MVIEKGFHSRFVGRNNVMEKLKTCLDESIAGKGQLVFISGEAGIGKTRLIQELKKVAISKNFRSLEGACIYHEFSDPYLPFVKALSDITTPTLVDESQKYVTIEEIFLINNAGVVVSHAARVGANILDEDIVGGMLSAVEAFVKDAFGDEEGIEKGLDILGYGATKILIEHGKLVFLAVVLSGPEPEGLREDLRNLVSKIEEEYLDILTDWDGKEVTVRNITQIIQGLTDVKYKIKRAIKDIDIKKEKDRIFERVLQLLIETSKDEPILLILEDIHWADISSLQLLQYVARNTKDSKVFIVGTYRPEELADFIDKKIHPLKETIQRMSRYKMFTHIELDRLMYSEVIEMLTSIFKTSDLPGRFVDRLYKETEGNPFFVEEMLYSLHDEDIISHRDGEWYIGEFSQTVIPSTIKDLVTLRIERLDDISTDAIKFASVIGQEFGFNVLGLTMAMKEKDLITTLEKLEVKKLIQVDIEDDELYRFNHSKIQEVVYEGLSGHRKRMMHEGVGMAMEELNKDKLENVVYKLAHHYSNTKDHKKALDYTIQAGEKASSEFALDEAFDYYGQALNVIGDMEESMENKRKKLEIITHLGDICYLIGEWDRALEYQNQLIELGGQSEDKTIMLGAYCAIGRIYLSRSEWDLAIENLEKSLKLGEETGDDRGVADSQYFLGGLYEKRGAFDKAIKHYGISMGKAVNVGDSSLIANAYLGIGRVHAQQGQYDESIRHMQKSVEILEEIGDLNELAKAYINIGYTNFSCGSLDKSISYHEKALKLAKKTGNIRLEGHSLSNLGESYIKKNELEKAINCLDKALEIFKKLDEKFMKSDVYKHYGCVYELKQEWDRSIEYFSKSLDISRELNMPYYVGCGLLEFGLMYKAKGDLEKAREQLSEALDIFRVLMNQEMLKKIEKELEALNI